MLVVETIARIRREHFINVRAYPRETQEMVFDAHDRAFALFKGACSRGIYDNTKTAVETIFVGKDRRVASCRCAATTWSTRLPVRQPRAGRRPG
jgi:hypothetical protein